MASKYLPTSPFAACRYTRVKTDGYGKFLVDGKHFFEIFARSIPTDMKQFGLLFGEQYGMSMDFEQQFLYGLRVLFAGLLAE